MPDISLPWGQGQLQVSLPPHWTLRQVASPHLRPAANDWPDRLARALSQPSGETSLAKLLAARPGGRIVLIVEDLTRHSPLSEILAVVLREVRHAGVADEQIEIVFANGMHPPMTAEQAEAKLGQCCAGIARRSNRYDDRSAHVLLGEIEGIPIRVDRGVAEADLRIVISSVNPHLQAGFGGGYKMIFPGCAHQETIRGLHRQGVGRRPRQLVGTGAAGNPMRRIIDAAGQMLDEHYGRSFSVQYLLDGARLPAFIAAGEVLTTHRMTAKQCSVACGLIVPEPGDVLIANAHPLDTDLWQSFKCIANTRWAVRPNGVIICLARCPDGLGGMKVPRWPISPSAIRRLVRWLGPEALASLATRLIPHLAGDAAFFVRMATRAIHRNPIYLVSPALAGLGVKFPGMHMFANVDDAVAAADAHLGGEAQRVVVFPSGGITFPVPPGAAP